MKPFFPLVLAAVVALCGAGCSRHTPVPTLPVAPARQQPQLSPAELAKRTGIPEKLVRSFANHGTNTRQLIGEDAEGSEKPAPGLVIDVSGDDWHAKVNELRREVGPGYLVFCFDQGYKMRPDQIALLRGTDQLDSLRAVGTSGPNYEIGPDQVLARAKKWDGLYGLTINGAGYDWMEAEFKRAPSDMNAFAQEVYKFCPDVVDQGANTVEELAREMKQMNGVFLWWD